ncbi:MAG: DMT family transporter [Acutalibacteraceae bacterium]
MKNKSGISAFMLFLTALIWGLAFVAQSEGMKTLGTYTFFTVRSGLAVVFLFCLYAVKKLRSKNKESSAVKLDRKGRRDLLISAVICGVSMFIATIAQQNGLLYTTVGKSGFITALYILLVPVFGLFLKKKVTPVMWICVAVAVTGMYLLCLTDGEGLNKGDLYTLVSAVFFAVQILTIGYYAEKVDSVKLSLIQLAVGCTLSAIFMLLFEQPTFAQIKEAAIPIVYAGVFSSGVAFTLQISAQKNISPTIASLIMSFESVFAALFGWIILSQSLNEREIIGCCLMFAAVISSRLPLEKITTRKKLLLGIDKKRNADV